MESHGLSKAQKSMNPALASESIMIVQGCELIMCTVARLAIIDE